MPNIKLKGQTGEVLTYEDVERVYFDSADEDGEVVYYTHGVATSKTVEPNFASGDMNVPIADGELVTELTIKKPDTLKPENIRSGVKVAGVTGDLIGDTEEVTVDLDMAEGGQVITPSAVGKVLSKVVVTKPGTMLPENIKAGVDIGGVVGEFSGDTEEVTVDLHFPFNSVETELLPLTTYSDFAYNSDYGTYAVFVKASYTFIVGETYLVVWDGETFECIAQDGSIILEGSVGIGNGSGWGLSGNGEPFGIVIANGYVGFHALTDTEAGGSHTVRIYQATEGAAADMVVTPSADGKVMSKVTITKPEGAEQVIAKGETLGGIPGEYVTPGTTKEIEPDFSEGDQTVTAEGDERWNEVVVKVPETLVPENIAKDVDVCGIVGTHEGGGGIGRGAYNVKVIDYDGTILAEKNLDTGEVFALPGVPEHEGLVFDGWSSPVAITGNTITVENQDITIGPMYHTESGAVEIDIVLTKATGLTYSFPSETFATRTSIDWGDGTTTSSTANGHTYSTYGEYTIKIYGVTAVAAGSSSGGIVYLSNDRNYLPVAIRFPSTVTSIGNYAFYKCYNLKSVTFPKSVTTIGTYLFNLTYALRGVTIPDGVTSIETYAFSSSFALESIAIPKSVTVIGTYAFYNSPNLKNVTVPENVTSIEDRAFQNCYALKRITIPEGVKSFGTCVLCACYNLTEVKVLGSISSIATMAFQNSTSIKKYDFTACTAVPTLANTAAFTNINGLCQILVPSSLYSSWIAATNWSTYANYIVAV